jgi:GT2 family glycosyltransferase
MTLAIQLVTWNSAAWLPELFASLKAQTLWQTLQKEDWKLYVWDNGSTDASVFEIERLAEELPHEVFSSLTNKGFAGGHNELFRKHEATLTLLLNPDISLEKDTLELMVRALDKAGDDVSGVAPRLMRGMAQTKKETAESSHTIDSLGLQVERSRRVIDVHAGKSWGDVKHAYSEQTKTVFGISGALPLFRTAALHDVAFSDGTIFSSHFGSYKEDVDLAFRLVSRGYTSQVVLSAVAYHARGSKDAIGYGTALAHAKTKDSLWVRTLSYRNHWYVLIQNEYRENLKLDILPFLWYELSKFFWHLLFKPQVLWRTAKDLRQHWPVIQQARSEITKKRIKTSRDMRRWWAA